MERFLCDIHLSLYTTFTASRYSQQQQQQHSEELTKCPDGKETCHAQLLLWTGQCSSQSAPRCVPLISASSRYPALISTIAARIWCGGLCVSKTSRLFFFHHTTRYIHWRMVMSCRSIVPLCQPVWKWLARNPTSKHNLPSRSAGGYYYRKLCLGLTKGMSGWARDGPREYECLLMACTWDWMYV